MAETPTRAGLVTLRINIAVACGLVLVSLVLCASPSAAALVFPAWGDAEYRVGALAACHVATAVLLMLNLLAHAWWRRPKREAVHELSPYRETDAMWHRSS